MDAVDLGVSDLRVLPQLAQSKSWESLHERLKRKPFFRSEGLAVVPGVPHEVHGSLLAQSRDLVTHAHRFFVEVADAYYERPDLRAHYLVNPVFDRFIEAAADSTTAPLSRLDVVLDSEGDLSVIEINPVGVCLIHMRNLLYMKRALDRAELSDAADRLESLVIEMVQAFRRHYLAHLDKLPQRPVLGFLHPKGAMRADKLLFSAAFRRMGWEFVAGDPSVLEVSSREITLGGTRIDLLWSDFLFYMAYQYSRYRQTRFPTKIADMSSTPAQAAEILSHRAFLEHLRSGRTVNISPGRSYLVLSKSLLSWVHRDDRPISHSHRKWLQQHVARTYSFWERAERIIDRQEALERREELVIKPCQYGGSHGVQAGVDLTPEEWAQNVDRIWNDAGWILQEFRSPARTRDQEWISVGLNNFEGTLGGMLLRTSGSLLVSARESSFIPVVLGD